MIYVFNQPVDGIETASLVETSDSLAGSTAPDLTVCPDDDDAPRLAIHSPTRVLYPPLISQPLPFKFKF